MQSKPAGQTSRYFAAVYLPVQRRAKDFPMESSSPLLWVDGKHAANDLQQCSSSTILSLYIQTKKGSICHIFQNVAFCSKLLP